MNLNYLWTAALAMAMSGSAALAQSAHGGSVDFGDDSGEFANDHECDDPRFTGEGMASSLSADTVGKDATDCQRMMRAGMIRVVRTQAESNVAECAKIDFGDDSSEWSNDNECDDPRFTGGSTHEIMNMEDLLGDATDCKALCESGGVWLK
jgi:hypothetical protein